MVEEAAVDVIPTLPDQLLGPYGLTAAAVLVGIILAKVLWNQNKDYISHLKAQISHEQAEKLIALDGWKAQTAVTDKIGSGVDRVLETTAEALKLLEADASEKEFRQRWADKDRPQG